ncbi:thiamine ABC transporter ATP-binding protein [Halocynthiibacter namhaensis]|uniref:thiamine ABC transporter ATP-binding protein n=1 Tax=Halocynthiibacter namhaensis TaxID=1290553 RepID=UPI00057939DE|nr:thiamine ABC transporter ATP-binding protein [Halocynthiibacter namhaensis]
MLRLNQLEITQGTFRLLADLSIPAGEKIAVIGASGGGKSTLLALIAGFIAPKSGQLIWQDNDITDLPPAKRPISMIFQDNNLFPHLTAAQNVGLGISPALRLTQEDHTKITSALDRVGLADMATRKPAALSGGQIARVALARLLVQGNTLVLLDEPFAALGPAMRAEMLDLVSELVSEIGATLLMVSHAPEDAKRIADQVVLVSDGIAHVPKRTKDLFENPPTAMREWIG